MFIPMCTFKQTLLIF